VHFLSPFQLRYLAAIVAGLLLAAAFPKWNVAGLAWIAPGFLLFTAMGQGGKISFRLGYLAGLANYLASLYWLLFIPFPAGAIAGWLSLSAYLALYPAVWVWLCWKLFPGKNISQSNSSWAAVEQFFTSNGWQRAGWAVLCAAIWVAGEMIVGRFLSGFPWNFLGASQFQMLPIMQIASITGVYGVSFLVVWISVSLVIAVLRVLRQPGLRWGWLLELRLVLIVLTGVVIFGLGRMLEQPDTDRVLKVALVQPSIPQVLIWDRAEDENRFNKIMELSRLALAANPDLLIWPESSMPNFTEDNYRAITNLVATHKVWMILGADDAERRPGGSGPDDDDTFNAAFLFSPQGELVATYHKQHLVIFGEYLPLARWLPFLRRIIPIPGDFTPGDKPVPFELADLRARLAPLICFEDVFPGLARQSAADNIDFLLNLTNDGWFGEKAAQWQQAASAVFRAVENGMPLVRCTNNGLTCWIDSRGRLREILRSESGDVYGAGFLVAKIPLPPAGRRREPTFYHRHGDWFGWGCVVLSSLACTFRCLARKSGLGV
jgi:apolipoprotein N-acyltransferase